MSAPPSPDATLGIPGGQVGEPPSPGQGTGGGLGDGHGTGAGGGRGPGKGSGSGGSSGGGNAGSPEGTSSVPSVVDWRQPPRNGYIPFAWTYRARPIVTPEAQANKVIGTAIFRATLRADGIITDIELVNPVQFMTEAAEDALRRCKFRPATVNGVPVTLRKVLIRIDVHY